MPKLELEQRHEVCELEEEIAASEDGAAIVLHRLIASRDEARRTVKRCLTLARMALGAVVIDDGDCSEGARAAERVVRSVERAVAAGAEVDAALADEGTP